MTTPQSARDGTLYSSLRGMIDRLAEEFAGIFSRETISRCAYESFDRLKDARVREFVPVFVYRFTRERLRAQARNEAHMQKDRPQFLFVCVHNAGRSQMAAAFASRLSGGAVDVHSAGSMPANEINPTVVQAMDEAGIDLATEFPKPLTDDIVRDADVVITMGCGDACPIYPGKRYIDWQTEDPAGQPIEAVRRIRDDIRGRIAELLGELAITGGA